MCVCFLVFFVCVYVCLWAMCLIQINTTILYYNAHSRCLKYCDSLLHFVLFASLQYMRYRCSQYRGILDIGILRISIPIYFSRENRLRCLHSVSLRLQFSPFLTQRVSLRSILSILSCSPPTQFDHTPSDNTHR